MILSSASFRLSQTVVSVVFVVAIIRTGPGSEPLLSETVAIPFTVSTSTVVCPGEFKYVPDRTGSRVNLTVTGDVSRLPLLSYTSALISVDSMPPPSLTTISLGLEDGISMYEHKPTALSVPITICFSTVTVSLIAG